MNDNNFFLHINLKYLERNSGENNAHENQLHRITINQSYPVLCTLT